ncbi:hypothetical protein Tco_1331617, partial [Tanacetum coccineum]
DHHLQIEGYVFVLNGGAVDCKSSKQSTTTMSATKAEYIAASEATMEALSTLVEYMIVAGVENRPPMLDKTMYNSWQSRMLLYLKGKKNGRMMLESIQCGPLVYPTIEENGQVRDKKYAELTEQEKLQDDCDVQALNIVLQGLPTDVYALVNHCQSAKHI